MDNQVLTWLVGVIAFCMIFTTVVVIIIGLNMVKIMKRVDRLLLDYQASGDISKLAVGTFFVGSLYRFLKKKLNSEGTNE